MKSLGPESRIKVEAGINISQPAHPGAASLKSCGLIGGAGQSPLSLCISNAARGRACRDKQGGTAGIILSSLIGARGFLYIFPS